MENVNRRTSIFHGLLNGAN